MFSSAKVLKGRGDGFVTTAPNVRREDAQETRADREPALQLAWPTVRAEDPTPFCTRSDRRLKRYPLCSMSDLQCTQHQCPSADDQIITKIPRFKTLRIRLTPRLSFVLDIRSRASRLDAPPVSGEESRLCNNVYISRKPRAVRGWLH